MIVSSIGNMSRFFGLHPLFETLYRYLTSHDLDKMLCGRISLIDDDLFLVKKDVICRNISERQFEAHRKYVDVHYLLSGTEYIGWRNVADLNSISKPYDLESDSVIFADPVLDLIMLHPGDIAIFFPEDAHVPEIGNGYIRKMVAKVKL